MKMKEHRRHEGRKTRILFQLALVLTLIASSLPVPAFATPASSPVTNPGFEDGLFDWNCSPDYASGELISVWTDDAKTYSIESVDWNITPADDYLAVLQPPDDYYDLPDDFYFESVTSVLRLSDDSYDYLYNQFYDPEDEDSAFGDFSYIYQDVEMTAGQSFTVKWNYLSTDSESYNDGSFCSFVNLEAEDYEFPSSTQIPTVNGYKAQVGILGTTSPGTGTYSTGAYSGTGWQTATFTASTAGTYRLGFAAFNLGDNEVSPYLFLDNGSPTTQKDGVDFDPIAKDSNPPAPPVAFEIVSPEAKTSLAGDVVTLVFTLNNYDADEDTFDLTATSLLGWEVEIKEGNSVTIDGDGGTETVSVDVTVPTGASSGDMDTVTLSGESQNDDTVSAEGSANITAKTSKTTLTEAVGLGTIEGLNGVKFQTETTLTIQKVITDVSESNLASYNAGVKLLVNGKEIKELYAIKLLLDGQPIQPDGSVKVKIKLTAEQKTLGGLQIIYVSDQGVVTVIPSTIDGDYIIFTTDHFSNYGLIANYAAPNTGDASTTIPLLIMLISAGALMLTRRGKEKTN